MRLKRAVYELAFVFMSSTLLYTIEQQVLLLQSVPTCFGHNFPKHFWDYVKKINVWDTLLFHFYFLGHPIVARATGCHVLLSPLSVRICEIVWVIKSEKFLGWCLSSFTGFCHEFYDKMECCLACNYEFAGLGCSFYFMLVFWCLIWIIVIHCKSVNCFYSSL